MFARISILSMIYLLATSMVTVMAKPRSDADADAESKSSSIESKRPASTSEWITRTIPVLPSNVPFPYAASSIIPQISPLTYSYAAPIAPVAYVPAATYSIERHGYEIAY